MEVDVEALTAFVVQTLAQIVRTGLLPTDTLRQIAAANEAIGDEKGTAHGGDVARRTAELARMADLIATRGEAPVLGIVRNPPADPSD